ncbi:heterokaryon incompatibility protein-domain-containing protein [Colletotrichum phormii]|uniref:Heterokaryon incompatibility protein-domain-containing protein n=1 Tax=Colletotrichum phormii TaxID=359342 RepID=A0AAI9ZE05_9PEZI|nr:heterokaryon incompatibility protein-domain-containing protein [Colletotrichum phormii]KAK1621786.1 heterokaryon incompatibility protein-domain-containing protein [Colletotrichum phormii]
MFRMSGSGNRWQRSHPDENVERWRYESDESDHEVIKSSTSGDRINYEALSYTWGSEQHQQWLLIEDANEMPDDNTSKQRKILIRNNLATAMQHLRLPDRPKRLWIDAICINQQDNTEKDHQVRRIGTIFKHAARVIGFLGPEDHNSGRAFESLRQLGDRVEILTSKTRGWTRVLSPEAAENSKWHLRESDLGFDDATWGAILELLSRDYFTRVWIVQECHLANARALLQCGNDIISLSLFRRAVKCLQGKQWLPSERLRERIHLVEELTRPSSGRPLRAILDITRNRKCSDPRDKVFGVLELVPPRFANMIMPNYHAPVAQVYQDTFLAHLRHVHRFELFDRCYRTGRTMEMPSWVPDFNGRVPVKERCASQFASGHSQAHFNHTEPNILNILGVLAATVTEVRPSFENSSLSPADLLSSWRTARVQPGKTAIDESGIDQAITLRMNLFKDRYPKLQMTTLQKWLSDASSFGVLDGVPTGSAVETNTEFQRYFGRTIQLCAGRAYIHTREALPGLAPLDTRTGDVIVVLLGCTNPLILRPGSSGQYTLIGECFMYGLSDANALLGPLPDSWTVQAFPGFGRRLDFRFLNQATDELVLDDPRLPTLCGWERIYHEPEADDPEIYAFFRNIVSSSGINSDPRMAPAALMDRGVNLRYFAIS